MSRRVRTPEAAAYIGVPEGTLRSWKSRKQGPSFIKKGRVVLWDLDDVDAWLAAHRVETKAA